MITNTFVASDQAGCPSGEPFINDDPESTWNTSVLPSLTQYYSETFTGGFSYITAIQNSTLSAALIRCSG